MSLEPGAGRPRRKVWSIGLWVAQSLLAVNFGIAGVMKALLPLDQIAPMIPWVPDVPATLVRFIGACELAGALGLVLPALTRIRPALTPLAAAGLATIMVLAAGFHLTRNEVVNVLGTMTIGAAATFVAWGRWRVVPIEPRG